MRRSADGPPVNKSGSGPERAVMDSAPAVDTWAAPGWEGIEGSGPRGAALRRCAAAAGFRRAARDIPLAGPDA
ncbi:hypothetical protein GCM10023224_27500 [Streptomonospora halophila]|uniref:Uncharacterized protein n=1 Tax=Streptomonospora halophila TaxID=427369 RepID=A0ABP9GIZ4_9ACTN